MDRPQDEYRYGPEELAKLDQTLTLEPVAPGDIEDHAAAGETLVTMDIPGHLQRGLAPDADTSIALYRLVQLFGTPNVPGLEAGADQPGRERTTWQYLFRATHTPDDEEAPDRELLVSVYDDRTNISVGLSEWHDLDDDPERVAPEPTDDPLPSGEIPPEEFLVNLVKLVLSMVEHAVEATYKDLRV